MNETIRVLLADDHPLVRAGLRTVLAGAPDVTLVGEATDGDQAQRLCREYQPNVLLLDLKMPGPPPAETVAAVRDCCPATRVLVLSAYADTSYVRDMAAVNVAGYVLKDEPPRAVIAAVRRVARGGVWFSQPILEKLARLQADTATTAAALTRREREVLGQIAAGRSNAEIARVLGVTQKTVETHATHLFGKLGVGSRTEAALHAFAQGILPPPAPDDDNG